MVVGAVERRAVVVHEVEEQVLEHDPAVPADDAAVIDVARILLPRAACVLDLRRGGRAARDRAAQQQRGGEAGVHEPREQADAGQPARGLEVGRSGRSCQRASSMPSSGSWTRRRYSVSPGGDVKVDSRSGVTVPDLGNQVPLSLRPAYPDIAAFDVAVYRGREKSSPCVYFRIGS